MLRRMEFEMPRRETERHPLSFAIVGLFCIFLITACAGSEPEPDLPNAVATPIFDNLIVPGQRIGPIYLGMPGSQLLDALGAPVKSHHGFPDATWNEFPNGVSAVVRDRDNRVIRISTLATGFATSEGVRVGTSEFEVRTRLGQPSKVIESNAGMVLCYRGMTLDFSNNRVYAVTLGFSC